MHGVQHSRGYEHVLGDGPAAGPVIGADGNAESAIAVQIAQVQGQVAARVLPQPHAEGLLARAAASVRNGLATVVERLRHDHTLHLLLIDGVFNVQVTASAATAFGPGAWVAWGAANALLLLSALSDEDDELVERANCMFMVLGSGTGSVLGWYSSESPAAAIAVYGLIGHAVGRGVAYLHERAELAVDELALQD